MRWRVEVGLTACSPSDVGNVTLKPSKIPQVLPRLERSKPDTMDGAGFAGWQDVDGQRGLQRITHRTAPNPTGQHDIGVAAHLRKVALHSHSAILQTRCRRTMRVREMGTFTFSGLVPAETSRVEQMISTEDCLPPEPNAIAAEPVAPRFPGGTPDTPPDPWRTRRSTSSLMIGGRPEGHAGDAATERDLLSHRVATTRWQYTGLGVAAAHVAVITCYFMT